MPTSRFSSGPLWDSGIYDDALEIWGETEAGSPLTTAPFWDMGRYDSLGEDYDETTGSGSQFS